MKKLNKGYLICGALALVSLICFGAVFVEWLVNDFEAASWVATMKILGFVFLGLTLLSTLVFALLENKKAAKEENKSNEKELLKKYKSVKNK